MKTLKWIVACAAATILATSGVAADTKCGASKCGGDTVKEKAMKKADAKCGGDKAMEKAADAKCGGDKAMEKAVKKPADAKCGAGKCGGDKK